jgi:hypothetical protein
MGLWIHCISPTYVQLKLNKYDSTYVSVYDRVQIGEFGVFLDCAYVGYIWTNSKYTYKGAPTSVRLACRTKE